MPSSDLPPPLPGDPRCPDCEMELDAYTEIALEDKRPKDGDWAVCVYCRALNVFVMNPLTGHYKMRSASDEESREMRKDIRMRKAMYVATRVRAERN